MNFKTNYFKYFLAVLLLVSTSAWVAAQTLTVTGTVTDAQGETLPGVNVRVQGTSMGANTDADGKYSVTVPNNAAVLQFTYIGYITQEIAVGNNRVVNVVMQEDITQMDEVVVVGYGVMRKSDVTGAMVSVNNEALTSRPTANVLEALQGRAAGVDITSNQRPGELGSITIRGTRSLSASNRPLYVVDGVPVNSQGGIENLNPQDIESIDILKDASATAIYGSRGANGVVLVTTKRGSEGRMSMNYSGTLTLQQMAWRSKYMNAAECIDFQRWASYNNNPSSYRPGDSPTKANDELIFAGDGFALENVLKGWVNDTTWDPSRVVDTDWINMVTQPNITQEHTLNASGGTSNIKAYASFGYLNNQGTTKGQGFERYTVRTSVDLTPKKWLEMGLSLNGTFSNQQYGQSGEGASIVNTAGSLVAAAAAIFPFAVPYDNLGNRITFPGGLTRVPTVVDEWKYSFNERQIMRMTGTAYLQANIMEGLRYRLVFGPDYRYWRNGRYNDGKSVTRGGTAFASFGDRRDFSWTLDNLLYYDKVFGKHSIGTTLLWTASSWNTEEAYLEGDGIPLASQKWYALNPSNVPAPTNWNTDLTERQTMSYMGRVNYGYNNKYILTVSGRWDGASQLAPGHKWAFFPSAALAWRMEQESFMQGISWVNQLKLRLGYGVTGNAAIDPYTTKGLASSMVYPFGNNLESGYTTYNPIVGASNRLANLQLGWEKTTQLNAGVDFSVFQGRLSGGFDVYTSRTTDLLMTMSIPSLTGYASTYANIGETKSRGVDVTLNTVNLKSRDLSWNSNFTITWQRNEIVLLMNGKEDMVGNSWFIGHPISVYYGYEGLGLWKDTPEDQAEMAKFNANGHQFKPGLSRPKDQNNDYRINSNDDRVILGNRDPRWLVGMNNTLAYKNWELTMFVSGRLKYLASVGQGLNAQNGAQRKLDYWTPNNPNTTYQMPIKNDGGGDTYYAVNGYLDNSFLKIRNISLGYTFPKGFVNTLKISSLKANLQISNPGMLWSNIKFHDADVGNSMYFNRGFVFGLNVGF